MQKKTELYLPKDERRVFRKNVFSASWCETICFHHPIINNTALKRENKKNYNFLKLF